MDKAACAAAPTDMFHPTPPEEWPAALRTPLRVAEYHQGVDHAIQHYCMACPVLAECREYGKKNFTEKDAKLFGIEVFTDENTGCILYIGETGAVTAVAKQ